MKLIYIYHSGFCIEGKNFTIIIDYYKDTGDEPDRGIVHDYLLKRPGKLYVLATHFHPDHFNPEILEWKEERPDIIYIFSKDILKHRRAQKEDAVYLAKLGTYEDENLKVKAYGSTDVGASFFIEAENKKIFHAGDLNNWHWNEESTPEESRGYEKSYLHELDILRKEVKEVDIAMFPVDPRLGKDYMKGAEQFVDRIKTGIFVPMHFDKAYGKANAFKEYVRRKGSRFMELNCKGESIYLKGDNFMEVKGRFDHFNINVLDLERSIEFYKKALGLKEARRKIASDGAFILVYLTDEHTGFSLELTWLRDRKEPYNLGDNESHLCLRVEGNYEEVYQFHKENGWVCYENTQMGLYFINDPDDYWIEILPVK